MAKSQPKDNPPKIRLPYERQRVTLDFPEGSGKTHQSFKDECDINRIIEMHTRTGIVTHLNALEPQYGDAPESTLFDAAVARAEINSALEDGWEPVFDDSEESDPEEGVETKEAPEASEAPQATENVDQSA